MSNDVLEGGAVPLTQDELLSRVNAVLANQNKRIVARKRLTAPLAEAEYDCFEVELKNGGKVKRVKLEALGRELGVVEAFERPVSTWVQPP